MMTEWVLVLLSIILGCAAFCVGRQQGFDEASDKIGELLQLVDILNGEDETEGEDNE